jgi:hypothetical protein
VRIPFDPQKSRSFAKNGVFATHSASRPSIYEFAIYRSFKPDWDSLKHYQCLEWFGDAKFGAWAVWELQRVPMASEWHARNTHDRGGQTTSKAAGATHSADTSRPKGVLVDEWHRLFVQQ